MSSSPLTLSPLNLIYLRLLRNALIPQPVLDRTHSGYWIRLPLKIVRLRRCNIDIRLQLNASRRRPVLRLRPRPKRRRGWSRRGRCWTRTLLVGLQPPLTPCPSPMRALQLPRGLFLTRTGAAGVPRLSQQSKRWIEIVVVVLLWETPLGPFDRVKESSSVLSWSGYVLSWRPMWCSPTPEMGFDPPFLSFFSSLTAPDDLSCGPGRCPPHRCSPWRGLLFAQTKRPSEKSTRLSKVLINTQSIP